MAMESRLTAGMDNIGNSVETNMNAIRTLREEISNKEEKAKEERDKDRGRLDCLEARLDRQLEDIQAELRSTISGTVREELSHAGYQATLSSSAWGGGSNAATSGANETRFWECRRSLRLWPIPGPNRRESLKDFLITKMKMDEAEVADLGDIKVQEARSGKNKNTDEVVAVFPSKEGRDLVKRAASQLAPYGNQAGVRIHVPGHLLSNFRSLESLAYHLKQKDPSLKRVVKFDEDNRDLFMDVKIGGDWKRLYPE